MNEMPDRLVNSQDGIDRLEALCRELDDEERVRLRMQDGSAVEGVVTVRPTVQTFRYGDGNEGLNALLRLDPLDGTMPPRYIWLDGVVEVTRLGTS